jgi:4-amino-4-deoxy-L-arabinose transferase-like glycosyltransferase
MPESCCELHSLPVSAPSKSFYRVAWPVLVVILLCLILFFFQLGDRDLASSHEARAGQDAQSMLNNGRWDLPRLFDGRVEMQKPPLFYWLVGLLGAVNGGVVDAWCVRLPSALSALGCVVLLWAWGVRRERRLAGFLAAMILATCVHFTAVARIGRIDMPLTLTVGLTVVSFFEGIQQRRREGGKNAWRWFLLGYLAIAAGIMLKGPIAIAMPLAVGLCWWLLNRFSANEHPQPPPTVHRSPATTLWGVPLVLVLTLPWFLWANYTTDGEFFRVFFWHHNIDRGFGTEDSLRAYPWWYYGPQMLVDLLPWSLLLPVAAWSVWRRRDRDARFGAVWFLAMLALLSCMRFKRSDYLLPAFPGIAWMLGCVAEQWYLAHTSRRLAAAFAAVVGLTASFWLGYITLLNPLVEDARTHRRFAEEVRRHTSRRVLFFWAEAHLLAFHIGQPLTSFVEWDCLDAWAGLPDSTYVVMPIDCFQESQKYLTQGTLEAVAYSTQMGPPLGGRSPLIQFASKLGLDIHERAYVLVRTRCLPPLQKGATWPKHATHESNITGTRRTASYRHGAAEPGLDCQQCGR